MNPLKKYFIFVAVLMVTSASSCPNGFVEKAKSAYESCLYHDARTPGAALLGLATISLQLMKEATPGEISISVDREARDTYGKNELDMKAVGCALETIKSQFPEVENIIKGCQQSTNNQGNHDLENETLSKCIFPKISQLCPEIENTK